MNAVIYARYSCDRQTEQSIEGQLRECKAFAASEASTSSENTLTVRSAAQLPTARNFNE